MNTNWIAALACGGALALGACSSNTATSPATEAPTNAQNGEAGTNGEAATPAEDTRTQAQKDFDTALANARTGLANARQGVTDAVAAANAAQTDAARSAALTGINTARRALEAAVAAAKEVTAPSGDPERIGLAAMLVDEAEAADTEDKAKLSTAEANTGWSGLTLVETPVATTPPPFGEGKVIRNERLKNGEDTSTLLTTAKLAPVMYEDGKIVIASGKGTSGDRLRMRGIPVTNVADAPDPRLLEYADGEALSTEPKTIAGLTITSTGIIVDIGGKGAGGVDSRKGDLSEDNKIASDGSNNGYDLKLIFGKPMTSPEGNAEYYWAATLEPTAAQLYTDRQATNRQITEVTTSGINKELPVGAYHVRLSNHVGLDTNLEWQNSELGAYTSDDVNYYLSYAAYGFMDFHKATNVVIDTDRAFPFHVGYDAFKDASGMRTTDLEAAEKITNGKFKGRTIAAQLDTIAQSGEIGTNAVTLPTSSNAGTARLRGDIELTATIGSSSDEISGKIENLETWDWKGYWEDFAAISGAITLPSTSITTSGSFIGTIAAITTTDNEFGTGGYSGNFYGPSSEPNKLEVAGIWWLNQQDDANADHNPIVGSFGAARVDDNGEFAAAVQCVGDNCPE